MRVVPNVLNRLEPFQALAAERVLIMSIIISAACFVMQFLTASMVGWTRRMRMRGPIKGRGGMG